MVMKAAALLSFAILVVAFIGMASPTNGLVVCTTSQKDDCLEVLHTEASFALKLPQSAQNGVKGKMIWSASNLCGMLDPRLKLPSGSILLVPRGSCKFTEKASNAATLGANALVIFDTEDVEELVVMESKNEDYKVNIPVVFVSTKSGFEIVKYIKAASALGESAYGLLFGGDDAQNYYAALRMLTGMNMLYSCMLLITVMVLLCALCRACCSCFRRFRAKRSEKLVVATETEEIVGVPIGIVLSTDEVTGSTIGAPLLTKAQISLV